MLGQEFLVETSILGFLILHKLHLREYFVCPNSDESRKETI